MKTFVTSIILILIFQYQTRLDEIENIGFLEPVEQIAIPKPQLRIPIPKPQNCRCKKIDSGSYKTPYAWNSNHPMVTSSGFRRVTKWIYFDEDFVQRPKVIATLSNIDSSYKINLRVQCRALNINNNRFLLEISTWSNTKLYGAKCDWIAHGY